jgi:hypothetical protein
MPQKEFPEASLPPSTQATGAFRKKLAFVAAGIMAFAIAGAAFFHFGFRQSNIADASPAPELISEVPAGASMLIYADLAAIRASTFYQQRPDKGPIAVPDRNYADFVQSTGFDFEKDLDRVVIASWTADSGQDMNKQEQKKILVLADGRFDRQKIRDYALRKGKLDHQGGREVFLFPTDNPVGLPAGRRPDGQGQASWNSITFLDDHRIAIVEGPSIALLLSHSNDGSTPDPVRERAAHVAGAAVFAISRVPPIPDNYSLGGIRSTQLLDLARSVQWVTLAARPEGGNVRVSLEGECHTDSEARQLQAALEVLRMFGRAGLENPKTRDSMDPSLYGVLETVLKTADVSASAEQVRVLVELTPDVLKLGGQAKTPKTQ